MMISINIDKAKIIAHKIRRDARSKEFAPYDALIANQVPNAFDEAESQRQIIREKYALMQIAIDSATTSEEIKSVLP